MHRLVGLGGQALEDVGEILRGVDAAASPMNSQFFLPMALGRIAFSTRLLSTCTRPSRRNTSSLFHWLRA
jgi:hypothetical protein